MKFSKGKATANAPDGPSFCDGQLLTPFEEPEEYKAYLYVKDLQDMAAVVETSGRDITREYKWKVTLTIPEKLTLDENESSFPAGSEQKEVYEGNLKLRWETYAAGVKELKEAISETTRRREAEEENVTIEVLEDTFAAKVTLSFNVCEDDPGADPAAGADFIMRGEMKGLQTLNNAPGHWNGVKVNATFETPNPLRHQQGSAPRNIPLEIDNFKLEIA